MSVSTEQSSSRSGSDLSAGLQVTWVGLIANVVLIVSKLSIGITGRSQALIADGIHSISDLFSDVVVFFGLKWGRKEADEDHPFGHGRIETFSSLVVGLVLLAVSFGIAYSALKSIYLHQVSAPSLLVIMVAAASIVMKEGMYWYTITVGRRIHSPVLIANAWHHRSDALSSVAVLAGVGAAYLNPNWYQADSFAALVVAYFIVRVAVTMMRTAIRELIDTAPNKEVIEEIQKRAGGIDGVRNVHDIRARNSGPHILLELHVVVDPELTVYDGHAIAKAVERCILSEMERVHKVTIHVDPDARSDEPGESA